MFSEFLFLSLDLREANELCVYLFVQALDFSDDEQERMAKQKVKAQRRPQQQKQEESDSGEHLLIPLQFSTSLLDHTMQQLLQRSTKFQENSLTRYSLSR